VREAEPRVRNLVTILTDIAPNDHGSGEICSPYNGVHSKDHIDGKKPSYESNSSNISHSQVQGEWKEDEQGGDKGARWKYIIISS
jgi:hypothetical protein